MHQDSGLDARFRLWECGRSAIGHRPQPRLAARPVSVVGHAHGEPAGGRDEQFDDEAAGTVGDAERGRIVEAGGIDAGESDIAQHALRKIVGRHKADESLLAEVAGIDLARTVEHAHVHDVVVINIVHGHAIVVVRRLDHLIGRRVHLRVAVIFLAAERDHGVALDEPVLVEGHGPPLLKGITVIGVFALDEFHHIAILVFEHKQVGSLLHDGVFRLAGRAQHQRVAIDGKAHRLAGGVGIEDGVALGHKGDIALGIVQPDALQHLLGPEILLRQGGLTASRPATPHKDCHEEDGQEDETESETCHRPMQ